VGGGGTTLPAAELPFPPSTPENALLKLESNPDSACTGGAIAVPVPTIAPAFGLDDPPPPAADACTGGGTTLALPTNPAVDRLSPVPPGLELPTCTGGGTTLVCRFIASLPPRVPTPWDNCAGGATTAGAGNVSFADKFVSRSGAETGGGTTSILLATVTLAANGSRCNPEGGGGTTVVVSAGAVRVVPCETCGGGAIIVAVNAGVDLELPCATCGAGGITLAGASDGAINEVLIGSGGGGTAVDGKAIERGVDRKPSAGAGPGILLTARRFATALSDRGRSSFGASTTFSAA